MIRVATELDADPATVWKDLRHIDRHVEWMHDAESLTFSSDQSEGVGTTFDCLTRVGPLRLNDRMEITSWVPEREIGVRHVGVVSGEGTFTLQSIANDRTLFVWQETLRFPWWLGGPLGARIGALALRRVWRRNLGLLAQRFTP